ncbi:hypothetical protein GGE67_001567 [Rhizobium leucaenae]|uniref:Uncharacterized protein n=1 Tax=Rhizobium leucaenae TaxID=29450 RepID=A0A7W6ZYF5_9HYPH|nr:hypothetical protein [Rhizobium leucaenae]MBB6300961.1 hypothetical protein [Rhizobium leucaenae]
MYKTFRENRPLEGPFPDSFYGFSEIPVFTEEMEPEASFKPSFEPVPLPLIASLSPRT